MIVDEISMVRPMKYIEPKRSTSVNNTQHITQKDARRFLSNTSVTIPTATISRLKFLISSSPMICKDYTNRVSDVLERLLVA